MSQLSKINVWNKDNQKMEPMYNTREKIMNISSHVYFAKLYHVIKYFSQLNQDFGKEDITLTLSSSSRAIERIVFYEFESGQSIIDTRKYHDFKTIRSMALELDERGKVMSSFPKS